MTFVRTFDHFDEVDTLTPTIIFAYIVISIPRISDKILTFVLADQASGIELRNGRLHAERLRKPTRFYGMHFKYEVEGISVRD